MSPRGVGYQGLHASRAMATGSVSVYICCGVLQCDAVCCSGLLKYQGLHATMATGSVSVCMCCSVLQCVAVCCSVLQCVVRVPKTARFPRNGHRVRFYIYATLIKCAPLLWCSVMQYVAMCCGVLQGVA